MQIHKSLMFFKTKSLCQQCQGACLIVHLHHQKTIYPSIFGHRFIKKVSQGPDLERAVYTALHGLRAYFLFVCCFLVTQNKRCSLLSSWTSEIGPETSILGPLATMATKRKKNTVSDRPVKTWLPSFTWAGICAPYRCAFPGRQNVPLVRQEKVQFTCTLAYWVLTFRYDDF